MTRTTDVSSLYVAIQDLHAAKRLQMRRLPERTTALMRACVPESP